MAECDRNSSKLDGSLPSSSRASSVSPDKEQCKEVIQYNKDQIHQCELEIYIQ